MCYFVALIEGADELLNKHRCTAIAVVARFPEDDSCMQIPYLHLHTVLSYPADDGDNCYYIQTTCILFMVISYIHTYIKAIHCTYNTEEIKSNGITVFTVEKVEDLCVHFFVYKY